MNKISIDINGLKALANSAKENKTQDAFIDLVIEWAQGAEAITLGYKEEIKKLQEKLNEDS